MKNFLSQALEDVLDLIYPRLCFCCQEETPTPGENTCLECRVQLPRTNIHKQKTNSFTERFLGRVPLYTGASYYHYRKGGLVRKLIYQLKYHGKKEIGIEIGRAYGRELIETELYKDIDLIVPVPLHPQRKRTRGYNQSDMFAMGLSEAMDIPWKADALRRIKSTTTQTQKGKFERLANMDDVFKVKDENILKGKHILLVDDVLTTGATMEVCGNCISEILDTKVSMATIAMASQ
jgi:ComF family protein